MKRILLSAVLLLTATLGWSQMQNLPNDPETKTGKLDNGLTYYIRHNDKPAQRAEFYLATNVGAIQEAPDQDGLAHFLEHMCFNGTKNFPGKGILNWLESIGASFGGNVNASTGVEQTIYLLNNIPLIRPTVVDTCLLIMHDYSHFVTCDPAEIDAERGVILEEKRTRNDASWRNRVSFYQYLFKGTKYADCTIIGSEENLKTFKPESLTNFYHTWYRPDNQALIVVGDIDVNEVEAKIKSTFADIPAPVDPKAKDVIVVPDNQEPIIGIVTDPENTSSSMEIIWKSEAMPEELNATATGLMTDILKDIISLVMSERLNDISSKPGAPFLDAGFGFGNACETMEITEASTVSKEGDELTALEAVLTEVEKMRRFGFSDSEVERAKTELLSQYETAAKQADTRKNSEFVMPMISNFFDNYPFMDPNMEYQLVQQIMPQLQSAVVNQVAASIITPDNMVVLYVGPKKDGFTPPTEAEISNIIKKVAAAEIERPAGEEIPSEFLDPAALKAAKVKGRKASFYGSETFKLSNGVTVYLYPSELEKDHVSFSIVEKGGFSNLDDEDLYSFESNIWQLYIQNTGVAGFPSTMVAKMLAGKQCSVTPQIGNYTHGVSGSSTTKDLESALQLAHLYYTAPRFDEDEYNKGIAQIKAVLPNLASQPEYVLQNELYDKLYKGDRHHFISEEILSKASLQTMERCYKELFKDAKGATMIVAGDFDKEEIVPLIAKYIGSIDKGRKATDWQYRNDGIISENLVDDFKTKMQTPKVTVVQAYKAEAPYSAAVEANYDALAYILNMVYTETLREEEGGTYGASAAVSVTDKPYEVHLLQVSFETNNEQADRLRELAVKGVKDIAANGPDADKFDKAVKNLEKNIPENKLRNAYWLNAIRTQVLYGYDYVADYEAGVKALTPEKVKAAAAELLGGNAIEFIMRPQE